MAKEKQVIDVRAVEQYLLIDEVTRIQWMKDVRLSIMHQDRV